jgi:hypothetical protein
VRVVAVAFSSGETPRRPVQFNCFETTMALQLLLRAGNLRGQGWHAGRLYELNGRGTSLTACCACCRAASLSPCQYTQDAISPCRYENCRCNHSLDSRLSYPSAELTSSLHMIVGRWPLTGSNTQKLGLFLCRSPSLPRCGASVKKARA